MTIPHRYCPICRRYIPVGREAYQLRPPASPTPPPWPLAAMRVLPTCPECGEPLGPTLEEIDTEVQDVGDVNL